MGGLERSIGVCPARDVNDLSWAPDGSAPLVSARDVASAQFRIFRVAVDTGTDAAAQERRQDDETLPEVMRELHDLAHWPSRPLFPIVIPFGDAQPLA